MQTVGLYETGVVVLDGNGNGTVRIRPDGSRERWLPTVASVSVDTNVAEADCSVYAGPAATQQWFIEGTHSGSTGDSTDRISGKVISRTQLPYVFAVWTGGDPGSTGTLTVTGTKEIP